MKELLIICVLLVFLLNFGISETFSGEKQDKGGIYLCSDDSLLLIN